MADMHFEHLVVAPQLFGPSAAQVEERGRDWRNWARDAMFPQPASDIEDFGDRRVFFAHDSALCGETGMHYGQSCSGPIFVFISDDVPDRLLLKMAERHGLVFEELVEFRDQFEHDFILATPAAKTH